MKNPFYRKPVSTDVRPLALTDHYTEPGRTTSISNPDTRTPIPHSANRVDPHENVDAYRALVRQKIAALAAAGGLDQDNLQALTQEIGSWLATWRQKVEQDAVSRTEIAQLLLAQTVQDMTVCSGQLTSARIARTEIINTRENILRSWCFTAPTSAEAAEALATAKPVITSRVFAISRSEQSPAEPSESDPLSGSDDTTIPASPVIDFPIAAPTGDQTNTSDTDNKELSA